MEDLLDIAKKEGRPLHFSAPMVRYSRLPFRMLIREYGVDIACTPMVMADCFTQSQTARDLELQIQTNGRDAPLVVQFAAKDEATFAEATRLVAPHVLGVDLNCGCPQRWAISEGIGCALLRNPQKIKEMILAARNGIAGVVPSISVKIRIIPGDINSSSCPQNSPEFNANEEQAKSFRRTVDLAQSVEAAGVSWVTLHGRTPTQSNSEPVNVDAIRTLRQSLRIPCIANGGIFSYEEDALPLWRETGVAGIMAARGILNNPALFYYSASKSELFEGVDNVSKSNIFYQTPPKCVDRFVELSAQYGTTASIFHHHLSLMTTRLLTPSQHAELNSLSSCSVPFIIDWWRETRLKITR